MKVMAASARTSASWREELAAISRAVSPMIVVSSGAVIRSTGSAPAPSSTAFCRTHSWLRARLIISNPGGPSPVMNRRATSRCSQEPPKYARAPEMNSVSRSSSPSARALATALTTRCSCASWWSCHSATNSSALPPKWW